jgi:hypothetical protein
MVMTMTMMMMIIIMMMMTMTTTSMRMMTTIHSHHQGSVGPAPRVASPPWPGQAVALPDHPADWRPRPAPRVPSSHAHPLELATPPVEEKGDDDDDDDDDDDVGGGDRDDDDDDTIDGEESSPRVAQPISGHVQFLETRPRTLTH